MKSEFILPVAIVISTAMFSFAYAVSNRYKVVETSEILGWVIDTWTKDVFQINGVRYAGNLTNQAEIVRKCNEMRRRLNVSDAVSDAAKEIGNYLLCEEVKYFPKKIQD